MAKAKYDNYTKEQLILLKKQTTLWIGMGR